MDALAWTGAIGGAVAAVAGIIAAIGSWRTEVSARWQARVERLRNEEARRENLLHRIRHAELYGWWHDMPDGPARIRAMRWFGEWTGARDPFRGDADGPIPPGFGCKDTEEAYERYVQYLDLIFHPGRPGPLPHAIPAPEVPEAEPPAALDPGESRT
jgi:hypothetical protein